MFAISHRVVQFISAGLTQVGAVVVTRHASGAESERPLSQQTTDKQTTPPPAGGPNGYNGGVDGFRASSKERILGLWVAQRPAPVRLRYSHGNGRSLYIRCGFRYISASQEVRFYR
jgi:hypothetical protein